MSKPRTFVARLPHRVIAGVSFKNITMKMPQFLKSRVFWFYIILSLLFLMNAGRITAIIGPSLLVTSLVHRNDSTNLTDFKMGFQTYVEEVAKEFQMSAEDLYFFFLCSFIFACIFIVLVTIGFFKKAAVINLLIATMAIEYAFIVTTNFTRQISFENFSFDILAIYILFSYFLSRSATKQALTKQN